MAFFRKLFGSRGADAYAKGIALFESGQVAESLEFLRPVYQQEPGSPRGSLAGYYLRQALVAEGRRLLVLGDAAGAATLFDEAAGLWPDFPDLQFLAGCAAGLAGDWDTALGAAHRALRRNADYCEARLLEAAALQSLARPREAGESLQQLLESGRRVDHQLVRDLEASATEAGEVPTDIVDRLRRAAVGDDVKQQVADAVALCRAGKLADGLAAFAQLGEAYPRYPDVQAKHAAALYQAGRDAEALERAEAALAINARYRTAVSLKGLILAEQGAVGEADRYLQENVPRLEGTVGRHEELFLAYLEAVLALLAGRRDDCRRELEHWNDLPRQFARAELLLAAADHLDGRRERALARLEQLSEIWTADRELRFLRVALLLELGEWSAADGLLGRWPAGAPDRDERPLLLRCRLDLARGREPVGRRGIGDDAADAADPAVDDGQAAEDRLPRAAWRQIEAATQLLRGAPAKAWPLLLRQLEEGHADEETGRLLLAAAAGAGERPPADLAGRIGAPDSWAVALCGQLRAGGNGAEAEALVLRRRQTRPEGLTWSWLSTGFWLDPVRRWLA